MRTIETRLSRLEDRAAVKQGGHSRVITVVGGACSEEELTAFLRARGIEVQQSDLLIFHALMLPSDNGPMPSGDPLRLMGEVEA